jgi:hypothetical protein
LVGVGPQTRGGGLLARLIGDKRVGRPGQTGLLALAETHYRDVRRFAIAESDELIGEA